MSVTMETSNLPMKADSDLVKVSHDAVMNALTMCDRKAECVGISRIPSNDVGLVTGMIGVHGKVSGFITVNMSERLVISAVEGLLQESFGKLTSQVVDGAGEITNIIVGGIKSGLAKTQWGFNQITVPSVIVGNGYHIAYSRGLEFANMVFEVHDPEAVMLNDRLMSVSISLLKL